MIYNEDKISARQAFWLYVMLLGSPTIRIVPRYCAEKANQAAWLSLILPIIVIIVYIFLYSAIFKKYKNESFVDVIGDIMGKTLGRIISIIYMIWITLAVATCAKFFGIRIETMVLVYINNIITIFIILAVSAYVLRGGIVVLARMNEILFATIVVIYVFSNIFAIPQLKIDNFYPITYKDIIPIINGSLCLISIWGCLVNIFLFADEMNNKENLRKIGISSIWFLSFLTIQSIIIPIGTYGSQMVSKMPFPYFAAVKEISLFDVFERIESGIIVLWMLTDFVLITAFSYAALHTLKQTFKLSSIKPFINIYFLVIFFLSIIITRNEFELEQFYENIVIPINIFFGYLIPLIVFVVGKIRKKI